MIYKIQGNFDEVDFEKILYKLGERFKFIYQNKVLYIALKKYDYFENHNEYMKNILKPNKHFFVQEITEKNIMDEPDEVANWCKDNFVLLEKRKYEINNQDKLRKVMQALDCTEADLNKELKNKKGGTQ